MEHINHSFFKRVLALMLCLVMIACALSACFNYGNDINSGVGTTKPNTGAGTTTTTTTTGGSGTTGDSAEKDPVEDPVDPNELFSASTTLSSSALVYGTLANGVTIGDVEGVGAIIPADVKVAQGAQSLAMSVRTVDESSDVIGNGTAMQTLDVHISGVASDNTVPMIVNLGPVLAAGLGYTELKLYHFENGAPILMTRVDSVSDFAIHNQYYYNEQTGDVTIYVASFSLFAAVQTTVSVWEDGVEADTSWYNENDKEFTLDDIADFLGFRDLVDAGNTFEGKTVILGTDIDLNKKLFDPIGFGYYKVDKRTEVDEVVTEDTNTVFLGTFDGGNHTIYNLYQNCWELDTPENNYATYTYSTAGAGLFASIKNATIKNLAISGAEVVFECVDMGVLVGYAQGECHFENIVITNANIANYNRYTGGLVGEVSYGVDTNGDGYSHTFKNITIDSSVKVCGLWGSFGCGMGGVIGGKWGDATVLMENVVSAPVMDVYNDVVSAYQWYAFRGCGMLIGHTEEPYSDGRHSGIATASFLTCQNVRVYYGDWVKYTYYEFANQDNATGKRYPWVRAEKGEYCDPFSNIRYGVPTHEGVKVSDLTKEELKAVATDYTPIIFNQLYGADQGMYGQAKHEGVTVIDYNKKTIYIQNNLGWENLKLHYWYKHGDDTWTNIGEDGIDMTEMLVDAENQIYKVIVPLFSIGFKITAEGENVKEFVVSDVAKNGFYLIEGEHIHSFDENGDCICGCKKVTVNILEYATENRWQDSVKYSNIVMNDDITVTASEGGNNAKYYSNGNNWRIYQSSNGTFTIDSKEGNIVSVKITYVSDNSGVLVLENTSVASGDEVVVNDVSVTFSVGNTGSATNGQARITDIEVVYSTALSCDHTTTIVETKTATCIAAGYTATKCIECGKMIDVVEGDPAIGHSYTSEVTKEANCTETGLKVFTCQTCQTSYSEKITAIGHSHNVEITTAATCTTVGVETYTCETCGDSYTKEIPVIEHNYENGVCTGCGAEEPTEPTPDPETPVETGWVKTDIADIKSTDIVVITWTKGNTTWALTSANGTSDAPTAVVVTVEGNNLIGDIADAIKWNISNSGGNLTIYPNGTTAKWLYCTSSNNGVRVGTNTNKVFTIDATSGYLKHTATSRYVGVYTTNPDIRCYTSTETNINGQTLAFYVWTNSEAGGDNGGSEGGETPCQHTNVVAIGEAKKATCVEDGQTAGEMCGDCGHTITAQETIKATGHSYVDGTCSACGAKESNAGDSSKPVEGTLTFDNTSKRTEFSTKKQVWTENGITLTNEKSSSTSNVADYSNPARFYASSSIVVEAGGNKITKIVFDCNNSSYATALKNSIGSVDDATVTVSDDKVTVEFSSGVDSFTIAKLTAQVRMDSITVTYIPANQ